VVVATGRGAAGGSLTAIGTLGADEIGRSGSAGRDGV
jgi:hypothetical protein